MKGVKLEADGKVYTTPELGEVAHHSGFTEEGNTSQVNAFIQKTFDAAGLTTGGYHPRAKLHGGRNSMEAAELMEILSSVTAGIYFTHIANIKSARDSLIASLRLVQHIQAAACPAEDGKALQPQLMWKTLMKEQHLLP